jgi:glucose/arabinose dehydrogenase
MASRRTRLAVLAIACVAAAALSAPGAGASQLPSGFRDQIVFSGLQEPTAIRFAPGGPIYVAEKTGIILAYSGLGDSTPTTFADLRTEANDSFDRGILGLAVDPNFPAKPYVYALYTYDHILGAPANEVPKWGKAGQSGDGCDEKPSGTGVDACPVSGRLVRLTADAAAGYEKAVTSGGQPVEKTLVESWCSQFSSHSVGDLQFGPEGALYASGGEGADANNVDYGKLGWPSKNECGDPPVGVGGDQTPPSAEGGALRSQDARTPFNPLAVNPDPTGLGGSLIRIDPETGKGWPGNPMATSVDENEQRIVGYGFRNPFRFSIQPGTGELYVGNVGWNNYEEIDRFKPSSTATYNSGWPCYEGPFRQSSYESLNLTLCKNLYAEPSAVTAPFFYYSHGAGVFAGDSCPRQDGSAVSGNVIYDGGAFPAEYDGAYFFADSVRGCIYVMKADEDGEPDPTATSAFLSKGGRYPGIDLEVGPEGDLYYVSLFNENVPGDEFGAGAVHRISYGLNAPVAVLTATPDAGKAPLSSELDASASSDPNGKALSYAWDLDGDGSFETVGQSKRSLILNGSSNVELAVRVTNSSAESTVATVTLYPGDTPPVPVIEEPDEALAWHVGQAIHFKGAASDPEDGALGPARLFWETRLYHCPQSASDCHVHPLQPFPGTASGTLQAPDHDYPSRIELTLTAVDSRGLAASKSIQLLPSEVDLQLATDPPGLTLSGGVLSKPAPFTLPAIEDATVTLSAPLTQQLGNLTYSWQGWSDGGARVHSVLADKATTYTAFYSTPALPRLLEERPSPELEPELAPRTRLGKHPPKMTRSTSARFEFSADQPGAGFECKLDDTPYKGCRSPRLYRGLGLGRHALRIRAVDGGGAVDATPLLFKWQVLAR